MVTQCPQCGAERPAFTQCPACGTIRASRQGPGKADRGRKPIQGPNGADKIPASKKPVEQLSKGELRNELIKKRGGPARQAALKREYQKRVGVRSNQSCVSGSDLPPHKLTDKQLRAEIRRGGAAPDRIDALYAERDRRRKKAKRKARNPESVPVHELSASELRSELKRSGKSERRARQLEREKMHRLSGLSRTRVVPGGAPGLGKGRGKR